MFGTIRKHQSWLWGIIIVAMILGLVVYFSPTAGNSGGQGSVEGNFGSIDGEKVTKLDFINASREANLAYFLSTGQWPDNGPRNSFNLERETYQRLFFIKKIKDHNIQVDSESVAQAANNILAQFGKGRPVPLDTFIQQILSPRASADDFERYLRHQLALQQLVSVISVGGELVTPQEAQALYIRSNQELATEAVFFSGTNYQTSVATPTPEVLREFYTNQASLYRVPDRVQVSYVSFDATNFTAQADKEIAALTNMNAIVEQIYQQRGTNFYSEAKTPEEAKEKIRAEMRQEVSLGEARKKADEFANKLFDLEPMRAENLATVAKAAGLTVKTTAPFAATAGPTEFDGGPNFIREAFKLNAEEPFAGPLIGETAVYVITLAKRIPSEVPPFETVRDRVVADYRHSQATMTARRAGNDFARAVTNGLAAGKTFAAICADAKVKPVTLPPISMITQELPQLDDRVSFYQFYQVASQIEPGKVSDFSPTADGGFVVNVQQSLPIDQVKMKTELPDFTNKVRQSRRQELIQTWMQREGTKSLRETPIMQTKPPQAPGQAGS
ncbi:MAG: SurA N-terminal domain-containing protein [Akkermansiaceae bacterium]|nr:SurA N-terminal domain-containing protein [Verrucomicrobiales bacterium]